MDFNYQDLFGIAGVAIGIYGSLLYIFSILKKESRPHFFTFFIWSILTWIGFFAQITDNPGAGMRVMLFTAISTSITFLLSIKYGTKDITKSDWVF